tara:strand:+ start:367 stop:516 length:150 start_codon:yes stop_codon:yes gene_type:complete
MTSKQKSQLLDLVDYTIIPAIYEDLGLVKEKDVDEAITFIINTLKGKIS